MATPHSKHKYGWRRDNPDPRDHVWALSHELQSVQLPMQCSLRGKMPPVYDQGGIGSCTANAIAAILQYQQLQEQEPEGQHVPSRLFIYWNERNLEGTVDSDSGAQIRDGMKVIGGVGAPPESDWPYRPSKFRQRPPSQAFADARKYTATYGRVAQTSQALMLSVYHGQPVVFGFTVFESFERISSNGIMPMPRVDVEACLGGHAVAIVGYKYINGHLYLEVRNSWGPNWGDNGYFWMPAAYAVSPDYCSDFWHVEVTT